MMKIPSPFAIEVNFIVPLGDLNQWFTNSLALICTVFGTDLPYFQHLQRIYYKDTVSHPRIFQSALGVLEAAKSDYEGGYYVSLSRTITREVVGDFVGLAKEGFRG